MATPNVAVREKTKIIRNLSRFATFSYSSSREQYRLLTERLADERGLSVGEEVALDEPHCAAAEDQLAKKLGR